MWFTHFLWVILSSFGATITEVDFETYVVDWWKAYLVQWIPTTLSFVFGIPIYIFIIYRLLTKTCPLNNFQRIIIFMSICSAISAIAAFLFILASSIVWDKKVEFQVYYMIIFHKTLYLKLLASFITNWYYVEMFITSAFSLHWKNIFVRSVQQVLLKCTKPSTRTFTISLVSEATFTALSSSPGYCIGLIQITVTYRPTDRLAFNIMDQSLSIRVIFNGRIRVLPALLLYYNKYSIFEW